MELRRVGLAHEATKGLKALLAALLPGSDP